VAALAAEYHHTCALTTAGGLKCWGSNEHGQLGDGTPTTRSTPVDVTGLTTGVAAVDAGYSHTCALTIAGGLKCWGDNESRQLGDGAGWIPVDVVGFGGPAVPDFNQCDYQGASHLYDSSSTDDICRWGCALSSAADVAAFWGTSTNPDILNECLKAKGGYVGLGVSWFKVPECSSLPSPQVHFNDSNFDALRASLDSGYPVIIGVNCAYNSARNRWESGHFVVATRTDGTTWWINDPGGNRACPSCGHTTLAGYGNTFCSRIIYQPSGGSAARLAVRVHSPAELVVTDPLGRRVGFDPRTGTSYDEVPGASYGVDSRIVTEDEEVFPGVETAWFNAPVDGDYTVQVIGTDTGSYVVDGEAYSQNGVLTEIAGPSGTTTPNQVDTAVVQYTSQAAVGGIAQIPDVSDSSAPHHIALAAAAAAGAIALTAGIWCARRRRAR
jgi:hypothetical protein